MTKRIIVPITGQGAMAHIVRSGLLDKIAKQVQPVILLYWKDETLINELHNKGYELHDMKFFPLSGKYNSLYYKINLWYLTKVLKFNGIRIEEKLNKNYQFRKGKIIRVLRKLYNSFLINAFPSYNKYNLKQEAVFIKEEKAYIEYSNWLNELNVDGLFTVTPFLTEINILARILKEQNKRIIASVHSFDNITKRGWQATIFDKYIVWNNYNKQELLYIYKSLKEHDIYIAGAPQFDFHYNKNYLIPKNDWLKMLGISAGKKVVLYAGGTFTLFPTEPQYAKILKLAIEEERIDKDVVILVRNHPLDKIARWKDFIGSSENIIYFEPKHGTDKLDYANVGDDDLRMLVSTLMYSDVHINLCSTMTVDGSVFNKPQIAPYFDDINKKGEPALQAIYHQEHYKPILKSKVLKMVGTANELIDTVNDALISPEKYTINCQQCVKEIITFTDGNSSNRVAEIVTNFFSI